ncbi:MAG: hypothetical protein CMI52_01875 [Parcubacteria group bacterium]|nr:hypothetical protein [Parcubacteria group bacterium]
MNVLLLFIVQATYSLSDLGKKVYVEKIGWDWALLKSLPFIVIMAVPFFALALQVYVLSRYELSKTMITLGVLNIAFATGLGVMVLKEKLTTLNYVGVVCAVLAVVLLNIKQ